MTIDVIRLAREAGFRSGNIQLSVGDPIPFISPISATNCLVELERFAALVAAEVMEEDAKVCEKVGNHNITAACASAIRARKPA